MVKLFIEYADKNNIILNVNGKKETKYPLINAINNNNFEMVKLLIDYANSHEFVLDISYNSYSNPFLNAINNIKIVKLLIEYANNNNIILKIN
ncbi:hypothetical protein H8356DRAFT_1707868, partial [Neocallimastix lanati (nom. inval.)]